MLKQKFKLLHSDVDEEVALDGKGVVLLGENIEEMSLDNIGIPAPPIHSGKPKNIGHSITLHMIKLFQIVGLYFC